MQVSPQGIAELTWWCANVLDACKPISHSEPCLVITTDASKQGWGAECQNTSTGGLWSKSEASEHINYLELLATFFGLKTFAQTKSNIHIRLMIDNTSAISFINNMGTSHSEKSNILVKQLWEWCIDRHIWVSAAHIPGRDNRIADFESRRNERASEWMLDSKCLAKSLQALEYRPNIDLFASRINKQFDNYVSYRPDPQASSIDAFCLTWTDQMFYAFPPFSVIGNVLKKIKEEKARGVCVLPNWPTQPWYPKALAMMEKPPVHLKASKTLLKLPSHPDEIHPIFNRLSLMVCLLSGKV